MIGGYMTFMGIEGKGRWGGTKVEEILPVTMEAGDDRVERPSGAVIHIDPASHPILEGLDETWSPLLGYNRLKAKEGGQVLVEFDAPQRAVAPGQTVVFYDGEVVVGGATIQRALP